VQEFNATEYLMLNFLAKSSSNLVVSIPTLTHLLSKVLAAMLTTLGGM
jgi:hypothetical protein